MATSTLRTAACLARRFLLGGSSYQPAVATRTMPRARVAAAAAATTTTTTALLPTDTTPSYQLDEIDVEYSQHLAQHFHEQETTHSSNNNNNNGKYTRTERDDLTRTTSTTASSSGQAKAQYFYHQPAFASQEAEDHNNNNNNDKNILPGQTRKQPAIPMGAPVPFWYDSPHWRPDV